MHLYITRGSESAVVQEKTKKSAKIKKYFCMTLGKSQSSIALRNLFKKKGEEKTMMKELNVEEYLRSL